VSEKTSWTDFFLALLKQKPLTLTILGSALLIIGATGGVPGTAAKVAETSWRLALGVLGILLTAAGVIPGWRENEGGTRAPAPPSYGIKIDTPNPGTGHGEWVEVAGSYNEKPPRESLWLFVAAPGWGRFWPQGQAVIEEDLKRWRGRVRLGGSAGEEAIIVVALVGQSSRVLCNHYRKIGDLHHKWDGIEEWPDDAVKLDTVRVYKKEQGSTF
jgi:hypothetical protein